MHATEILEEIRRMPQEERRELLEFIESEYSLAPAVPPEHITELESHAEDTLKNPNTGKISKTGRRA